MPRNSISVKGLTYQRLKDYCDSVGTTTSGQLEEWIHGDLDAKGVPRVEGDDYEERQKQKQAKRAADKRKKQAVYKEDITPQYLVFGAPGCQSETRGLDRRAVSR